MTLTARQKKSLETAPPAEAIRSREENGTTLSYLEGWYVIQEANRIFGAERWDRITLTAQCVWQGRHDGKPACTYTARVRLCVRTKDETFVREGSGAGHAQGTHLGEAHGHALKAAETDATKRALATLGAPFGLTLYDAQAKPETPAEPCSVHLNRQRPDVRPWILRGANGEAVSVTASPILCCSALRRAIEGTRDGDELLALYENNKRILARLVAEKPNLRDKTDRHYAEILSTLYQGKLKRLSEKSESRLPVRDAGALTHPLEQLPAE